MKHTPGGKHDKRMARRLSQPSEKLAPLAEVLEEFTGKSRVDEIAFDARAKAWRIGFENGHTVVFFSDGTCRRTVENG